jgi:predicted amino acid racemase
MSTYPKMEVHLDRIANNARRVQELCRPFGIKVAAVTKGFCAVPEIAKAIVDTGIGMLADSRMDNIKGLQCIDVPKMLLRIPMISELDDVVSYVDVALISEVDTARVLGQKAKSRGKKQKVVVMVDLGDLREGIWPDKVENAVGEMLDIEGIHLYGIGTNLTCYGGVIPTVENIGMLVDIAERLEERFGIEFEMVSGGNTNSMRLIFSGEMPSKVNNLRIGECILLGRGVVVGEERKNFRNDTFVLKAEVVEVKEKPSIPIGKIGKDAFGNVPVFEDRGIRRRAIIALGRQDAYPNTLIPEDDGIIVLGASSDHTLLDISDCEKQYRVGDIISFNLTYAGMLGAMTSPYVKKEIIR